MRKTAKSAAGAGLTPMILQRRAQIVEIVRQSGAARVSDLAKRFSVSEVTIRNDLTELEQQDLLLRDRGGALPPDHARQVTRLLAVEERAHLQTAEKRRIAHAAAALVRPGDTILMDAGTTVVEMTPHLAEIEPLTVITNAANVALEMGANSNAQVVLLGGVLNRASSSMLGGITEQMLSQFVVQKAFLGAQAFDLEQGLSDTTLEIAQMKRAMIKSARNVILLADSSKIGQCGSIKVAPLSAFQSIITDAGLSLDMCTSLEECGVEVLAV